MAAIVDIQGFNCGGRIIPREVAILLQDSSPCVATHFRQPIAFHLLDRGAQRHVTFATKRLHGHYWDHKNGEPVEKLAVFLTQHIPSNCTIMVHSEEVMEYLKQIEPTRSYLSLARELGCPDPKLLRHGDRDEHCSAHPYNNTTRCAVEHVFLLQEWLNQHTMEQ